MNTWIPPGFKNRFWSILDSRSDEYYASRFEDTVRKFHKEKEFKIKNRKRRLLEFELAGAFGMEVHPYSRAGILCRSGLCFAGDESFGLFLCDGWIFTSVFALLGENPSND